METIERTVAAPPTRVWQLWTTGKGIAQWWAPDGFRTDVTELDLVPGGKLVYTMTAVAPEQIAFMEQYGMPLATESHKYFTEIVDLEPSDDGTRITMQMEPLHDEVWTQRLIDGRTNELANLEALVAEG